MCTTFVDLYGVEKEHVAAPAIKEFHEAQWHSKTLSVRSGKANKTSTYCKLWPSRTFPSLQIVFLPISGGSPGEELVATIPVQIESNRLRRVLFNIAEDAFGVVVNNPENTSEKLTLEFKNGKCPRVSGSARACLCVCVCVIRSFSVDSD